MEISTSYNRDRVKVKLGDILILNNKGLVNNDKFDSVGVAIWISKKLYIMYITEHGTDLKPLRDEVLNINEYRFLRIKTINPVDIHIAMDYLQNQVGIIKKKKQFIFFTKQEKTFNIFEVIGRFLKLNGVKEKISSIQDLLNSNNLISVDLL